MPTRSNIFRIAPRYQPICREIGIDAEAVFDHELIRPWRTLADRENCTLDVTLRSGDSVRWHVKRYPAMRGIGRRANPAETEVAGFRWLDQHAIPTAKLVAWGRLSDGRSFVISDDLVGYDASDKLIESGAMSFDRLLDSTADLAAALHGAGLHHRDLYLCHFFAKEEGSEIDVKLIDVARVRPLPTLLRRRRWIIKDLAQFWFSTMAHAAITESQRVAWLERYASQRGVDARSLRSAIERKSNWIARHDAALRNSQPNRNISIPTV